MIMKIAKRNHLTAMGLVLSLAVIASCSKGNEPVQKHEGNAIEFRPSMATKAAVNGATTANLAEFQAIIDYNATTAADKIDVSDLFTKNASSVFNSTQPHYWPSNKTSQVGFFAYAPAKGRKHNVCTAENVANHSVAFRVSDTISCQQDFIVAYKQSTAQTSEAIGVELTFNHALAKISVVAKNDESKSGYSVSIKGIKLGKLKNSGTLTIPATAGTKGTWSNLAATPTDCAYDDAKGGYAVKNVSSNGTEFTLLDEAYIIPQSVTAWETTDNNVANNFLVAYKMQVKATANNSVIFPKSGSGYEYAAIGLTQAFEAGKHYKIILDFSKGLGKFGPDDPDNPGKPILGLPIKFVNVSVVAWVDATPITPSL